MKDRNKPCDVDLNELLKNNWIYIQIPKIRDELHRLAQSLPLDECRNAASYDSNYKFWAQGRYLDEEKKGFTGLAKQIMQEMDAYVEQVIHTLKPSVMIKTPKKEITCFYYMSEHGNKITLQAHEDGGYFKILLYESIPGLQIEANGWLKKWRRPSPIENHALLFVGQHLEPHFSACNHRVKGKGKSRISILYSVNP